MSQSLLPLAYPKVSRGMLIVWGSIATYPIGGTTWHRLHYLAGLRRLGFDVWYVEDSDRLMYSSRQNRYTFDYEDNLAYLAEQMNMIGFENRWIFRPPGVRNQCLGAASWQGLRQRYRDADAVLNISGAQELKPYHEDIETLVYIETDPVENQVRVAKGDERKIRELAAYKFLFSYGLNLGAPDCLVPLERFRWVLLPPPVLVDLWSSELPPGLSAPFTTVANWVHTSKQVEWQGETWRWTKDVEFKRFIDLPKRVNERMEITVGALPVADRDQLNRHGWTLVPTRTVKKPLDYRRYIQRSRGEFTASKEQFVRSRSGWFSERSVCYLAAGRPVITQGTGFSNHVPTGKGLFAFETMEDILAAFDRIQSDYAGHCSAAQEIANEYFSAEKVLGHMMDDIGL